MNEELLKLVVAFSLASVALVEAVPVVGRLRSFGEVRRLCGELNLAFLLFRVGLEAGDVALGIPADPRRWCCGRPLRVLASTFGLVNLWLPFLLNPLPAVVVAVVTPPLLMIRGLLGLRLRIFGVGDLLPLRMLFPFGAVVLLTWPLPGLLTPLYLPEFTC